MEEPLDKWQDVIANNGGYIIGEDVIGIYVLKYKAGKTNKIKSKKGIIYETTL